MQNEELFLEFIEKLIDSCKEAGTSKEEALFLRRILKIIQMPTRTLKSSLAESNDKINTSALTYIQRFTTWLQSFVDVKLDSRNRSGFISILQKSIHFKNTYIRDKLIELVMLAKDECNLAMFVKNLMDFKVFLNTMTPRATLFFDTSFCLTEFCKMVKTAHMLHGA